MLSEEELHTIAESAVNAQIAEGEYPNDAPVFRAVAEAAAKQALEDAAVHLETPGMLWWGSMSGAEVYESEEDRDHGRIRPKPLGDWLRARAASISTDKAGEA